MNKQAEMSKVVVGLIIMVALILFTAVFLNNQKDNTLHVVEGGVLDPFRDFVGSNDIEKLPSISSSGDFLDDGLSSYAKGFVSHTFDDAPFAEKTTSQNGYISIYTRPPHGGSYPEDVVFTLANYNEDGHKGVAIVMSSEGQKTRVASPKRDTYMRNISLCVLPDLTTNEFDALFALHQVTNIPMANGRRYSRDLEAILKDNKVSELSIIFNDDASMYVPNLGTGLFAVEKQEYVMNLHYVTADTHYVCFFPVKETKRYRSYLQFDKNNNELKGTRNIDINLPEQFLAMNPLLDQINKGDFNEYE